MKKSIIISTRIILVNCPIKIGKLEDGRMVAKVIERNYFYFRFYFRSLNKFSLGSF